MLRVLTSLLDPLALGVELAILVDAISIDLTKAEQLLQLISTYLVKPLLVLCQVLKLESLKEVQVHLISSKSYSIKAHSLRDLADLLVTQLVAQSHVLKTTLVIFISAHEYALLLNRDWALTERR